jgi:hypothetical protein
MMTRTITAIAVTLALVAGGCADQPKNKCKVAPGRAVVKYQRKGQPTGTCDTVALPDRGEVVGMQPFVPSPTAPGAIDEPTSFSIKPEWLGDRIAEARNKAIQDPTLMDMSESLTNYPYGTAAAAPAPTDLETTRRPYALGKFGSLFPDDAGLCTAASVNASELVYPPIPAHRYPDPEDATNTISFAGQPATAVKYVWSNVRVIQTPQSPGTQTFADVAITRDGCSASYGAAILVPIVSCGKESGGKTVADPTACDPNPNPTNLFGSGISQGVPTLCEDINNDPSQPNFVCVPTRTAP